MSAARLTQFKSDARRARDLIGLGQSLGGLTNGMVDASDMYRAAVVQGVAAVDSYVHGVVLDRAVAILLGKLAPSTTAGKLGLHVNAIRQILTASDPTAAELLARTHIAQKLSLETYQRPDDIASALASVGLPKIWSTAYPAGSKSAMTALSLVVRRRNRIVHQCDADPLTPGSATPILDTDAVYSMTVVEEIVASIDAYC